MYWSGLLRHLYFNPRSHEGSDVSTPLDIPGKIDFNPRSHEGSDQEDTSSDAKWYDISIRAPTRGATMDFKAQLASDIFQSALPRGERHFRAAL